jgi:hypothetical protein
VTEHYDVVIIGTGAGGGTIANVLAHAGKRILLLERGDFLPRELGNWDPQQVFVDGRYVSPDTWYDADGRGFQPQVHYFVGGATKMYGAALYRLRPADFGEIRHADGLSPAWPVGYDDFEPWYTKAEWLYQVHGAHGEDPTEGHWSRPYPWPAVSHEPRIQQIADAMRDAGYHPFAAPCGILLDEERRAASACIRCATCDGYPCLVHAKSGEEPALTRLAPQLSLEEVARHAVDFWLTAEDLPRPGNRVTVDGQGRIHLAYQAGNADEAAALYGELRTIMNHIGFATHHLLDKNFYLHMSIPVAGVAHQAGHLQVRRRPRHLRPRRALPGARAGQPVRGGRELLPEHRRGESCAHRHGERDPGRRAPSRADGLRVGRNRVRVAGRRPPAEGGMRALYQQVLRSFAATGHGPSAADLAETAARYGTTAAAVLAALHVGDHLQLGPDGQIRAAYPFSGVPTLHLVDIDGGPRAYAMCAIDALGMAAMLGTGVTVTSADPRSGEAVTVSVRADGKTAAWQPPTAVVFNGRLISAEACGPGPSARAASADVCCGYMNFFGTRASAVAWGAAHPGITGEILGQAAALRLGADIFSRLLSEASDGSDR